jgi:hypothetical protein
LFSDLHETLIDTAMHSMKYWGRHESDGPYLMLLPGIAASRTPFIKNFPQITRLMTRMGSFFQKAFIRGCLLAPVVLSPEVHGVDWLSKETNHASWFLAAPVF